MNNQVPEWLRNPVASTIFVVLLALLSFVVACHTLPNRKSISSQEWDKAKGPVMPHDNFPGDCRLCHEPGSWTKIRKDFRFDHEAETGVPLTGAHRDAQCLRCHNDRGPVAVFADRGCVGCHQDTHRGQLGKNCQDCHNIIDWSPKDQIARHNRTRFPLVGVHAGVACQRCHTGADVGNFSRAPTSCALCHQQDLSRAVSPHHKDLGWVDNCNKCHSPTSWNAAVFTHSNFPLTGVHATTDCNACHTNHVFQGLSQDCFACHSQEYQATTMPNHAAAGFSTDCKACHGTFMWATAGFDHSRFPLTGAHAAVKCSVCHQGNIFSGLSQDCFSCHLQDYQATTMPSHLAAGFPTDCKACHNTIAWETANFDHSRFPLTGAHTAVSCAQCHQNDVFAGLSHDCFACHSNDYQQTTNPAHATSGFPTTCQDCHNTTSWSGTTFTHTFNITSGPHSRFNCAECHQVPNNFMIASCTQCHEHRQSVADDKHSGVAGYAWSSPACISCHPQGR